MFERKSKMNFEFGSRKFAEVFYYYNGQLQHVLYKKNSLLNIFGTLYFIELEINMFFCEWKLVSSFES